MLTHTQRPLGGRHAAVIPALPEDYQEQGTLAAHHPDLQIREQRRRASMSEKEERHSPPAVPQPRIQTPLQSHLQTIILPPPTTSETLNIHEYQPPGKEEKRTTRGRTSAAAAGRGSHSQSPTPGASQATMRTRSSRIEAAAQSRPGSVQPPGQTSTIVLAPAPAQPRVAQGSPPAESAAGQTNISPYIRDHQSPPPVPATFASIMNAYPAPGGVAVHAGGANGD